MWFGKDVISITMRWSTPFQLLRYDWTGYLDGRLERYNLHLRLLPVVFTYVYELVFTLINRNKLFFVFFRKSDAVSLYYCMVTVHGKFL